MIEKKLLLNYDEILDWERKVLKGHSVKLFCIHKVLNGPPEVSLFVWVSVCVVRLASGNTILLKIHTHTCTLTSLSVQVQLIFLAGVCVLDTGRMGVMEY